MPKVLFMTFDDGPNGGTEGAMDLLKNYSIPATFFLNGKSGIGDQTQKKLVEAEIAAGHQLGNHCYIHQPAKLEEYEAAYGDMTKPEQKAAFKKNLTDNINHYQALLSKPAFNLTLVRLPGDGRRHKPSVKEVTNLGYKHIGWDFEFAPNGTLAHITEKDWQGLIGVACTYKGFPPDKAIVLAHDRHWIGKMNLLDALLKKFVDNGHTFELVK
jgi:peptidoglycan/xylan/chitin deacetylase (PgdA/CDA1 family)